MSRSPADASRAVGPHPRDPSFLALAADWLASIFEDRKSYSGFKARCEEAWRGELEPQRLVAACEQATGPKVRNRVPCSKRSVDVGNSARARAYVLLSFRYVALQFRVVFWLKSGVSCKATYLKLYRRGIAILPVRAGTVARTRLGGAAIPALGRGQKLGQGGIQHGN